MIGVNVSGAEYSWMPFVAARDLDYLKSQDVGLIRLNISWERMQPHLNGPLDQTYLSGLKTVLHEAADRGMQVIVDVHNYGRYNLNWAADAAANWGIVAPNTADASVIGSPEVPISAFANFWGQLSAALSGTAGLSYYDIMNEPYNMGSSTVWPQAAQAAVDAIRANDGNTSILVEGTQWASAFWWPGDNGSLHINDPAGKMLYEAHAYFDASGGGFYKQSYDDQGAYPQIGVDRLQPFLNWLQQNHAQGFIGEFGIPTDDPKWLPVLSKFVSALDSAGISGTYWNYVYPDPSGANPWWPVADPMSLRIGSTQPDANDVMHVLFDHTPVIQALAPEASGGVFDKGGLLTGTASAGTTITIFDGSTPIASGTPDQSGTWTLAIPRLAGGHHSLTAASIDTNGDVTGTSAAVQVDATASDSASSGAVGLQAQTPGQTISISSSTAFKLITSDSDVVAGGTLSITANNTSTAASFVFDGSKEMDGHFHIVTGGGNDILLGGAQSDTFFSHGGDDTIRGNLGADVFDFLPTDLTNGDIVDGGNGSSIDEINFMTSGTVAASAFANVSHVELIKLFTGPNSVTLTDALASSADDSHVLRIWGNSGDDRVDASALTTQGNAVNVFSGSGDDTLIGGSGADVFRFAAADLTGDDTVNGGAGFDRLVLTTPGVVSETALANVSHIERIVLANGGNSIVLSDALVHSSDLSHTIYVSGGTGDDTVDASAVTESSNRIYVIAGSGADSLIGGSGADTFVFNSGFNEGDMVDGGTSSTAIDLLITSQDTVAASMLTGISHIERIVFEGAGNHNIALTDALVSSADDDHLITVVGNSGNDTLSGLAVNGPGNHVRFFGLGGADNLVASAGNDIFFYGSVSDSTGDAKGDSFDRLEHFSAAHDRLDLPNEDRPHSLTTVGTGSLSSSLGTFDSDLSNAIGSSLKAHSAVLFHATDGGLSGHDFLVVNPTSANGYASGADFVFDVTGYTGTFSISDFI